MVSLLSVIGYRDNEIMEVLNHEQLSDVEIDFLIEKNQDVKKWQSEPQPEITQIINQDTEQDDEKLILELLRKKEVDQSIEELVLAASVLHVAIEELREPLTEMIKSGASKEETVNAIRELGVEGDCIALLYQKIASEIPAEPLSEG